MFKCWNSVVAFPLVKFLAARLVAIASIYQKILWFGFGLIYVVLWLVTVHFISEPTKSELIITIFEHDYVCLSPTLRINVFS